MILFDGMTSLTKACSINGGVYTMMSSLPSSPSSLRRSFSRRTCFESFENEEEKCKTRIEGGLPFAFLMVLHKRLNVKPQKDIGEDPNSKKG